MTKPKRVKTSERVAEKLIALLEDGKLKAGERLPSEHELMRQFGVGRSSVREAIRGLVVAGILEARPRLGTVVVSSVANDLSDRLSEAVTFWAIKDLYELREVLEGHAAAAAARRATAENIAAIERAHALMVERIHAGISYYDANSEYHLSIARAAQNSALVYCLASIIDSYRETRERMDQLDSVPAEDIVDHERILAAVKARDSVKARRLMQAHLRRNIARLEPPRPPTTPVTLNRREEHGRPRRGPAVAT